MKLIELTQVDDKLLYQADIVFGMPALYYLENIKAWTRDLLPEGINLPAVYDNATLIPDTKEYYGGVWIGAENPSVSEPTEETNLAKYSEQIKWATAELAIYQDYVDLEIPLAEIDRAYYIALKQYRIALNEMTKTPDWPSQANWPEVPTKN